MSMINAALWRAFFATPVSGDAKLLALHLALNPHVDDVPTLNVRIFAETLRLTPPEYERAHHELRDPRVGWLESHHVDRPQLRKDASPRALFAEVAPSPVVAPPRHAPPLHDHKVKK